MRKRRWPAVLILYMMNWMSFEKFRFLSMWTSRYLIDGDYMIVEFRILSFGVSLELLWKKSIVDVLEGFIEILHWLSHDKILLICFRKLLTAEKLLKLMAYRRVLSVKRVNLFIGRRGGSSKCINE